MIQEIQEESRFLCVWIPNHAHPGPPHITAQPSCTQGRLRDLIESSREDISGLQQSVAATWTSVEAARLAAESARAESVAASESIRSAADNLAQRHQEAEETLGRLVRQGDRIWHAVGAVVGQAHSRADLFFYAASAAAIAVAAVWTDGAGRGPAITLVVMSFLTEASVLFLSLRCSSFAVSFLGVRIPLLP